jgi:hypothetical protein
MAEGSSSFSSAARAIIAKKNNKKAYWHQYRTDLERAEPREPSHSVHMASNILLKSILIPLHT